MLRPVALAALFAALSVPAAAQSHLADSSGVFVGASTALGFGGRSVGTVSDVEAVVGYRQANGLDYSLRAAGSSGATYRALTVAPTVGYTRQLDDRSWLRLEGSALATTSDYESSAASSLEYGVSSTSLAAVASAGLGRTYRLGGSFTISPSVSAYGRVGQIASWDLTGADADRLGDHAGEWETGAGLRVDLPLSFRLLGQDVTVSLSPEIPVFGSRSGLPARSGIRINF